MINEHILQCVCNCALIFLRTGHSTFFFAGLPFPYLLVMVMEMARQMMKYDNGQKLNILGVERCSEGDSEQDGCALAQYDE